MKRPGILKEIIAGVGIVILLLIAGATTILHENTWTPPQQPDFSPVSEIKNASWTQRYVPAVSVIDGPGPNSVTPVELGRGFLGSKQLLLSLVERRVNVKIIVASFTSPETAREAVDNATALAGWSAMTTESIGPVSIGGRSRYLKNDGSRLVAFSQGSHLYVVLCNPLERSEAPAVCLEIARKVAQTVRT